jgi:large subunit ribosomal protein L27
MSKTKASGTSKLGRDSRPKYLGVKLYSGQEVGPGMIIIKQKGTKFLPGKNVRRGRDDSLYSIKQGKVEFSTKRIRRFDNSQRRAKIVSVCVSKKATSILPKKIKSDLKK